MQKYIHSKITTFIDDDISSKDFMNQDNTIDMEDPDKNTIHEVDINLKVIVITIACCHKLNDTLGIWDNLKDVLIDELD